MSAQKHIRILGDEESVLHFTGRMIFRKIQCGKIKNFTDFEKQILAQKNYLIEISNREVAFGLVRRGGGVREGQDTGWETNRHLYRGAEMRVFAPKAEREGGVDGG